MSKVWFVTGASKGFGLEFVRQILANGDKVAATSRTAEALEKQIGKQEGFLPLTVDLVSEASVKAAIDKTVSAFGGIDYVVNNAGFGIFGTLEELSDSEARSNFDVNVFGTLNVVRAVMPVLRQQRSGHIFNFSSIGGYVGDFPGFGIYCATKFAVTGLTEGLASEGKPFNIKATVVMPGYFRTNFLEPDSIAVPENEIADYEEARVSQKRHMDEISMNQPGDPVKGVAAVIAVAGKENAPVHLFLGKDAYGLAVSKMDGMRTELEAWKETTTGTDF